MYLLSAAIKLRSYRYHFIYEGCVSPYLLYTHVCKMTLILPSSTQYDDYYAHFNSRRRTSCLLRFIFNKGWSKHLEGCWCARKALDVLVMKRWAYEMWIFVWNEKWVHIEAQQNVSIQTWYKSLKTLCVMVGLKCDIFLNIAVAVIIIKCYYPYCFYFLRGKMPRMLLILGKI